MKPMVSLYQRSVRTLVWVAFALLALLPLLSLLRMAVIQAEKLPRGMFSLEITTLGVFVACSWACGLAVLLTIANKLRQVTAKSAAVTGVPAQDRDVPGTCSADGFSITSVVPQNELTSLTVSLTRIQSEFSHNLGKLQDQAAFLENLQTVLNCSSDMVVILDERNRVTFSNRAAREKLGLLSDFHVRHALAEGLLSGTGSVDFAAVLESWENRDEELQFTKEDGGQLVVHCLLTVVQMTGQPRTKIVVIRDVTDRRRMERQLYRSEQLAALGQLISGVAHELNNPLAAVLGFAELCRDSRLSREDLHRNLQIIEREAGRTAHIVENLLNFSRQRTAKRNLVDIHDLLERCFTLLAYNFRTNGVTVRRNYSENIPHVEVDEYQIQQVFMNLIINAAQAMKEGGTQHPCITVSTRVSDASSGILVDIADNGPGIRPQVVTRIFEPFFTTKAGDQGTGLGLTVSRSIARAHKGDITVTTKYGEGTVFTVRLPLTTDTAPRPVGADPQPHAQPALWGKVLVMDDEPSVLAMTQQALTQQGIEVTTATSLSQALQLLQKKDFDLVIADLCMPDGDGADVWQYLQRSRPAANCRVIFATGDPQLAAVVQKRFGKNAHTILKPFHVSDLGNAVTEQLRTAGRQQTVSP